MNGRVSVPLQIKSLTESGEIVGYGSVWDVVDLGREKVVRGAFSNSLQKRMPRMLWQHDTRQPAGVWKEVREDEVGLFVRGNLAMNSDSGRERYELLKMGALDGLSIGYGYVRYEEDKSTGIWTLYELDLWEVSPVTFPMNEAARVLEVKQRLGDGETPTKRELELILRDAGLSNKAAKAVVAEGWRGIVPRDAGDEDALAAAQKLLQSLKEKS